jgi:hydrogenase-4 component F
MSGVLVQTFGSKKLSQLRGLFRMSPLWSMTLIAGGLAISGAPPFGSFVSEIAILANCAQKGLWLVVICLLLGISLGFLSMMQYFTGIISGPLKYDINISKKKRLALIPIALILISIVLGTELDISTLIK